MMKAIRVHEFGGPEVLRLEEIPVPSPGPGEILLKVEAIGVNPVETYQRSGSNPALALPWTPGTDVAGTIEDVGDGVDDWEPGDRAYTSTTRTGAYAMWTVAPASGVHPLHDRLSAEQGAALGIPYATAWRALVQRAQATPGESVLIHGASGGVGLAAVQIARSLGLRVIGTAGTPQGAELARSHGADHVLDHTAPGYLDALPGLTDGAGPAIILEMLANKNLAQDARIIAQRGRIIVIGCRGPIEINPRDLMIREADVRGLLLFNCTPAELAAIHTGLAEGVASGSLNPVIGKTFPLADAARAHNAVLEPGAGGKIILLP
jgi:NADPH2:quinone reductase